MAIEIERRFLVRPDAARKMGKGIGILQAYFPVRGGTGRVRRAGSRAFLTFKGRTRGISRRELECPIPVELADALIASLCLPGRIVKTRRTVRYGGRVWEIDVFGGRNRGLAIAEVELDRADAKVRIPPWVGAEISGDFRFANSNLARHPFQSWPGSERRAANAAAKSAAGGLNTRCRP